MKESVVGRVIAKEIMELCYQMQYQLLDESVVLFLRARIQNVLDRHFREGKIEQVRAIVTGNIYSGAISVELVRVGNEKI